MKPYYADDWVTIYHGDCLEILPKLSGFSVVISDPPYGYSHSSNRDGAFKGEVIAGDEGCGARDAVAAMIGEMPAVWFGTWKVRPPDGKVRACCVWDKGLAAGMGDLSVPWKPNWELFWVYGDGWSGRRGSGVLRAGTVPTWSTGPTRRDHPNEKPVGLLMEIIQKAPQGTILDPFAGSGTTGRAAKDCGRKAILIELEERYCEIAAKRMAQETLPF